MFASLSSFALRSWHDYNCGSVWVKKSTKKPGRDSIKQFVTTVYF